MKLKCPQCQHSWEEEVATTQPVVGCPECFEYIPVEKLKVSDNEAAPEEAPAAGISGAVQVEKPQGNLEKTHLATGERQVPKPEGNLDKTYLMRDEHERRTLHAGEKQAANFHEAGSDVEQIEVSESDPGLPTEQEQDVKEPTLSNIGDHMHAVRSGQAPLMKTPDGGIAPAEPASDSLDEEDNPFEKQTIPSAPNPGSPGFHGQATIASNPREHAEAPTIASEPPDQAGSTDGNGDLMAHSLEGQTLGGYEIERKLGAGGMGMVYLARQVSLDREVALKVLPSNLAELPELVARFTREALSAARLNHHNVIQVFDVGNEGNVHYIAMEFVKGSNLGDMIKDDGRLTIDDAAGYILQATRGLKYAHDRGVIHRDIKPDNIMVNELGIAKIADMGLAKMKDAVESETTLSPEAMRATELNHTDSNLTMASVAMGTPAYMSPEQSEDAASVDHRADQYSLGCTLYYLCAGKAPYSGTTVNEIISKHRTEKLPPLDVHVANVSPAFSRIIERMTAKDPEDRYPSLIEVEKDLSAYLGVDLQEGAYKPREQHAGTMDECREEYYHAPSLKKRLLAKRVFFIGLPVLILVMLISGNFTLAGSLVGLLVLTPAFQFALEGIKRKTFLFRRVRSVFFGMPIKSWIATVGWAVLSVVVLYTLGWLWGWLMYAFVAAGLAYVYQRFIAQPLTNEREPWVTKTNKMFRELRLKGLSEEGLQDFVCRFGGTHWEEFFEEFFSYEDMLIQRGKWAKIDKIKPRKKHATWRDPLARWLDEVEEKRQNARERKQLAKVEKERLKAEGLSDAEAEKKATIEADRAHNEILVSQEPESIQVEWEKPKRHYGLAVMKLYAIGRILFSLVILAVYSVPLLEQQGVVVPENITKYLGIWTNLEWSAEWYFMLAGGAALFLTGFSKRVIIPTLVMIGCIILLLQTPLVDLANQPQLDAQRALYMGLGLSVGGFALCLLSKLSGGKF
jgi:serine/threonine protein kinase